jgi:hypothetical protein
LPGGVQCRATLGVLLGGIINTCPSHLIRLYFISPTMDLHLLFLSRSLLVCMLILLGPKPSNKQTNNVINWRWRFSFLTEIATRLLNFQCHLHMMEKNHYCYKWKHIDCHYLFWIVE